VPVVEANQPFIQWPWRKNNLLNRDDISSLIQKTGANVGYTARNHGNDFMLHGFGHSFLAMIKKVPFVHAMAGSLVV